MVLLERLRQSEFLGRDFLVWLWFKSETNGGEFDLGELGRIELRFGRKIKLQAEGDRATETITCAGHAPHMKEARFALTVDKKVTEAEITLTIGKDLWSFVLDAKWMNFKSLKTPKVVQDKNDDPDGLFYEKIFLVEKAISVVDALYFSYVKLRLSPQWGNEERPQLIRWIREGR